MKSNKEQITQFLQNIFPKSLEKFEIEAISDRSATVRYFINSYDVRPGGTVSGPSMMLLADFALYITILAEIGLIGNVYTTNMNINFLSRPTGGKDIRGVTKLLKVGRSLVVGEVYIYSVDSDEPVAHVTATFAKPAKSAQPQTEA